MRKILFAYVLLLSFSLRVAQSSDIPTHEDMERKLTEFTGRINSFTYLYPQEKVYLHFDNTGYYLGETIWFKAYLAVAENNFPSGFSKVLYTELLSPEGYVIESKKYKVENGTAYGDFMLKDSLYAGFYEVRAYTQSMLNFGEEVVFSRVFPVFDRVKDGNYTARKITVRSNVQKIPFMRKDPPKSNAVNIEFFPEGGNLVAGVVNRIAFKASREDGQSIEISGTIHDISGTEITSFSSQHLGMGSFEFHPDSNVKNYYAKVAYNGIETKVNLPVIQRSGYAMRVNNLHPNNMMIQVEQAGRQEQQLLGLTVSCRGKLQTFNTISLENGSQSILRIPKDGLPSGVIQITLFTAEGKILAERLAFVNHNDAVLVDVALENNLEAYKPIKINFELKNKNGLPVETSFSLSVRDKGTLTDTYHSDDIRTNLLLSSDLKGYIENPGWYFESADVSHQAALDLLMLVQGWRRYNWMQMAGVEPFEVKYGIESSLMIEGHVSTTARKRKQKDVEVKMWMTSSNERGARQGKCITDEEGGFNFALDDIYGKWKLNLQTSKNGKAEQMNIILNRNRSPAAKYFSFYENTLPEIQNSGDDIISKKKEELIIETTVPKGWKQEESNTEESKDSVKSYLLNEVTVTAKRKYEMRDMGLRYANIVYDVISETDKLIDNGEHDSEILFDFLIRTNNYFSEAFGEYRYKLKRIMFLVDNTLIEKTSWRNIGNIYMRDVESIMISEVDDLHKMFTDKIPNIVDDRSAKYPFSRDHAVVFIYTNKDGKPRKAPRGTRKTFYTGYSYPLEFYNPDYNYADLPDKKDFRRTLYWHPNVETNGQGKASISFFNNSTCKEIDISAEGLTNSGIPVIINKKK